MESPTENVKAYQGLELTRGGIKLRGKNSSRGNSRAFKSSGENFVDVKDFCSFFIDKAQKASLYSLPKDEICRGAVLEEGLQGSLQKSHFFSLQITLPGYIEDSKRE